jgi:polyhydroxybutyrate depolymerase
MDGTIAAVSMRIAREGRARMGWSVRDGWAAIVRLAAALLAAVQLGSAPARADDVHIPTPQGLRKAILLPAESEPAPTVVVLHGAISNAAWAAGRFGFAEAAAARGFAAAFPQAMGAQWNIERAPLSPKVDDASFLRRLAIELVERGVADLDRIYIAGVSSGGMMALRMVCEASDLFAGAGTVIASMPVATGAGCRPPRPVPIVMFNGTADRVVPYRGGGVGPLSLAGFVWGVDRTAEFLADANGCGPTPRLSDAFIGRTSVTRIAWVDCDRDATVTLYRVNGGRHKMFGQRRHLSAIFGKRWDELSAAETIMSAFAGE